MTSEQAEPNPRTSDEAETPSNDSEAPSDEALAVVGRSADAPPPPTDDELPSRVEALLFVSDGAVEESALARALGVPRRTLLRALDELAEALRGGGRGVRLQRGPEGAQLVSAPEAASHVEYFLGLEAARRLSTAALETLAIVAYRQPVTRGTIEAIRGVSSDAAVATLRARGLLAEGGRAAGPGRPVLWVTTQRFLQHFGLEHPSDLPPLPGDIELPEEETAAQLTLDDLGELPEGDVDALARAASAALVSQPRLEDPAPAHEPDD